MSKNIKVLHPQKGEELFFTKKKNVCAYARVSNELRFTSFDNQIQEYTTQIMNNPNWEFKGVFTDNGVSGFSTKTRIGFLKMIRTCKTQKIDLIITKSLSRFARNTLDTLKYIQELKTLGTEVYFEKENIYTFDSSSELLLSLMSSVAEEEVKQVSKNVKWRIEKNLLNGTPVLGKVYGYDVKDIYDYTINKTESNTVRLIFEWFIEYKSYSEVKKLLEKNKIITPTGKTIWSFHTIKTILQNPIYIGDLHRRRQINVDGKKVINKDYHQYYIENHHEPIITNHIFSDTKEIINEIISANRKLKRKKETYPLTGLLYCGHCGFSHRRKVAYYKKEISSVNYSCSTALKNSSSIKKCTLNNIYEPLLLDAVQDFMNTLFYDVKLIEKLNNLVTKIAQDDIHSKKISGNQSKISELEKEITELSKLDYHQIIQKKINLNKLTLKETLLEEYSNRKYLEENYNTDYFNYLLDEYRNIKMMSYLDNSILKSLIHKIIVVDQENIFIVLSSDTHRGTKEIIDLSTLSNNIVLISKTIYKQRKGRKLSLKYKVVYHYRT